MVGVGGTDARTCPGGLSSQPSVLEPTMLIRLLVAVVVVATSADAFAFNGGPLQHFCRKTGFGWSDGYHAPRPSDDCGFATHMGDPGFSHYYATRKEQPHPGETPMQTILAPQPEPRSAPNPPINHTQNLIEPQPSAPSTFRAAPETSLAPVAPGPAMPHNSELPQPTLTPPTQFSINPRLMIRRLPAPQTYDRSAHRPHAPAHTW